MNTSLRRRSGFAALAVATLAARASAAALVFTSGPIYTASDAQPRAEVVVCVDGRITFVGAASEARRRAPADARLIDLKGATLLPGFVDAHVHLAGVGSRELNFNLEGTTSVAELQRRLKQRAA